MEEKIAGLVYINDTTWVASSSKELHVILDKAKIFYEVNDFQINTKKLRILVITKNKKGNENYIEAETNNKRVYPEQETEALRYLEVYYTAKR